MRKIFTFLTLIFFTTNTLVWGAPADAVSLLAGNSRASDGITLVHIQDAHSNYEAQKNIQEILKNLHEKEGFSFVALEGAWQPLAPEVYHFFPNAKSNLKIADFLAQKGEMSGAELYAFELAEVGARRAVPVHFEGVEDPKVFRENYELFKKGLAAQDEVKKYCNGLFAKLDLEKSRVYSPGFLRFDRNVRDYENKHLELSAFLRVLEKSTKEKLQIELISPDHQREWPYLCRMLRVMNAQAKFDMDAVKKDVEQLKIKFPSINFDSLENHAAPREFFEDLYAASLQQKISIDEYHALHNYSELLILKSEITGPELFAEMDNLIEKLSDIYAVSPKEKELLAHSRQTRLLEKLLKYEATGKEWEKIKRMPVDAKASSAFHFYQLAESRNQILFENTLTKMKSRGVKKAILITGGFHSDGIESLAKQKNISYRTIQPQIHEEFSNQRYRDAVLGAWCKEITQSKIPKPAGMVKDAYDPAERAEIIKFAIPQAPPLIVSKAASLGTETPSEKLQLAKRLHADLFNKTISTENRRKIAEELIDLDSTVSFQDSANARGRMLDEIVRSSTPEEASERLRQLSAVLCAEAETQIRKAEELGYKRDPEAVLLGQAGYRVHLLATMMTDPVRYLEESENPNLIRAGQYLAIAGVFAVTILAFVNISQEIAKMIMGGLITGVFALFLGAVIYSIIRTVFPEKAKQAFDWENQFGPNDVSIFKEFRQEFRHGDYDFSKINRIENVSLRLGLISEIVNAHERGTLEDAEEVKKFKAFLSELKRSGVPRLTTFADKLLEDKFQDNTRENEKRRRAEGASLGQFDPLGEFEKELKKKWEDFFYQTGRLGMNLAGEDFEKFRKLRRARLAFLYYAMIDGRSYDKFFWDWPLLPVYFAELPVKYHTVRAVEWLNLVFPRFTPKEIHSEDAAQERTDFLQKALQEIENNYTEFLRFRFQGEDPINLIEQAVGNALSETYLHVLEERGEDEVLNYINQMGGFLESIGAAKKSDGIIRVTEISAPDEVKPERITLYEAGEIDLPWDPVIQKMSVLASLWNWVKELISGFWQLLSELSSAHRVLHQHHELFLDYLELLKNREAIGMTQIHFGTAWDMQIVHLLDLDQLIDGLKQNKNFVVKIINQTINTREIAHRTYPEEPGILKQKLLAGNASIEISKADPSKTKLYRRQIGELKDAIREEKMRQQQWQSAKANSLGIETGSRPSIQFLTESEAHQLALEVIKRLGGTRLTREEAYWLNGQVINFETDQEFNPRDPILGISRLMRIGPLIFVLINRTFDEESIKAHIKAIKTRLRDIYPKFSSNIFIVNPTSDGTETKRIPIGPHTRSMIAAMLANRKKITGAVSVDLGAGAGILSRIALGLGARQAVLVEGDSDFITPQKVYLESQGWTEKDFRILNMDMGSEDFKRAVQELNLPARANVVLANIGPWPFYGAANETAIAYAASWPNVGLFINGGYGFRGEHAHPYITRLLNLLGLNLNEGQFPGFRDVQKRLHKHFGFKTAEYIHWVSSEPRHNFATGTIIAVKEKSNASSLGKKISERFRAPRFSEGISKDKAWFIFNLVVYTPDFLKETNKKLKLGLGDRPIRDFSIEQLPSNNKDIYKIKIVVDGGSTAEFVLYWIQTKNVWNPLVNGYEKGAEFNWLNPGFRLFPKVGVVRLSRKMHWVSVEYIAPYLKINKKKRLQLIMDAYFRLFKAGWTLTDLYFDQVMITRPGKKIQAKIIDLDYLRNLKTGVEYEDDLIEQVRKMFNSARQAGGKEELIETARIGKKYLPKEIILAGFLKFSAKIKYLPNISAEDEIKTILGMKLDSSAGSSLGAVENELKKFESELKGKKITDARLKEMVDWAETAKKFENLRNVFVQRLLANENNFAAKRGLAFLNARESGYHEFAGLIAPVSSLDGGKAPVRTLAVSPDARLFASGNENGLIKVWDVETGQLRYRFEEQGYGIKSLQFSADSRRIQADGLDFSSRIWMFNNGQKITNSAAIVTSKKYITFDPRPLSLTSSDSKRLIVLESSGNIKVWSLSSKNNSQGKILYEIIGKDILSIDISSDDRFFVTGSRDGRVIVWDFGTEQPFQRAFLGGSAAAAYSVKFSPDSNWLISGGSDGLVRLWAGHERKLKGFWQRFKLGFQLSDAEVKAVQDRIDYLGRRENYAERNVLEAYGENWQNDLVKLASVQGRKLAAELNQEPKWKNNPVWLQDALIEFLHNGQGFIPQKQRDSLIIIEDEMRHQLGIPHPRPQDNTSWNDVQNILLVLDLLRHSKPVVNLPDPIFPQTSGLSLGVAEEAKTLLNRIQVNAVMMRSVVLETRLQIDPKTGKLERVRIGGMKKLSLRELVNANHGLLAWRRKHFSKNDRVIVRVQNGSRMREYPVLYIDFSKFGIDFPMNFRKKEPKPDTDQESALALKSISGNKLEVAMREILDSQDPVVVQSIVGRIKDLIDEDMQSMFEKEISGLEITLEQKKNLLIIREIMKESGYILMSGNFHYDPDIVTFYFNAGDYLNLFGGGEARDTLSLWVNGVKLVEQSHRGDRLAEGKSLGYLTIEAAQKFSGGIYPLSMCSSSLYPETSKAVVVSDGFSVTVKMNDNFNLEAERKYLREHPRSVSVVLDRTGRIHEQDRLIVISVKPGQEAEAIQSLLSGKDFTRIAKLARKLYEKPGVRLKQSAIHKRITIEASHDLLNQIGLTGTVQLLEIPDVNELTSLKINPHEFSAYALVHAALLGRAEGNLNDPLLKPFRSNIERDPVTGIYRIVRNSLADRIAALQKSLDVSRKILAAA